MFLDQQKKRPVREKGLRLDIETIYRDNVESFGKTSDTFSSNKKVAKRHFGHDGSSACCQLYVIKSDL
jgi:hypothetical protein